MVAITQQFGKDVVVGMYDVSWDSAQYDPTPDVASKIFGKIKKPETGVHYQTTTLIGMDELQETSELEGYSFRSPTEGWTVYARPFDFTDAQSFSSNLYEDVAMIKELGKSLAATWGGAKKTTVQKFYASFFNNGGLTAGYSRFNGSIGQVTDSSGDLLYDGYPLFNLSTNARSSKKGGTYYNAVALDISQANAKTMYNLFYDTNAYDDNDERIPNKPDALLYPPALHFDVDIILNSTLVPGNNNNDKNVLQAIVTPEPWEFLTDTDAYGFIRKQKGFFGCTWKEQAFNFFVDETGRQICFTTEMRLLGNCKNWRHVVWSNASTS